MRVQAGGQGRFHGWTEIVSAELEEIPWDGPGGQLEQTIEWKNANLQLHGKYKVQVTFSDTDLKALAPRLLTKFEIIELANLTDDEKIQMAREALANTSNGDKPDVRALFKMVETMLPRDEIISLLDLDDAEKILLAKDVLLHMNFGEALTRLSETDD